MTIPKGNFFVWILQAPFLRSNELNKRKSPLGTSKIRGFC